MVPHRETKDTIDSDAGHPIVPGAASGGAGLFVFLVLHHVLIVPIWYVLPLGLPIAVAGGVVVSRAFVSLRHRLPHGHGASVALAGIVGLCLLPAVVLAELRDPMFALGAPGGAVLLMSPARAVGVFVVELLATAGLAGGLIGWLIGGSRRASLATALAGLAFAIGPGHNIPFGGGTPAVPLELLIMTIVALVAAVVLVACHARHDSPAVPPAG